MDGRDDGGSLLLLGGMILALALLVTGFTLSEVAELEKESVRDQDTSFTSEYRSARDKLGAALADTVTPTTTPATFLQSFEDVVRNFDELETGRGYEFVAVLGATAGNTCLLADAPAGVSECLALTTADAACAGAPANGLKYANTGDPYFDGATVRCYDGVDDGVLVPGGVIRGAYVYLHLSDPVTRVEEARVYPLNT